MAVHDKIKLETQIDMAVYNQLEEKTQNDMAAYDKTSGEIDGLLCTFLFKK